MTNSFPHPRYQIEFVVLSFEGPDPYSLVGGLGIRVTELTKTLADLGYNTRLFFVGDPDLEDYEISHQDRLHYHRWSRWLSKQYPDGVYHGERAKVEDYENSLPDFLVGQIITKNAAEGVFTVVLGEDWQTATSMIRIAELLQEKNLQERALLFWNANNVYGFEAINFERLTECAHLLTISSYMKERMRALELEAMICPNGIPPRYWSRVDKRVGEDLKGLFPGLLLTKVGRFHPDKRWKMAIRALAQCKEFAPEATLLVRGGREEYRETLRGLASQLGLSWTSLSLQGREPQDLLSALRDAERGDIMEIQSFLSEKILRTLYWSSTAVLANSGHEPFGLVGLEVMACGGVAVTGSTGEDYVKSFHNGLALSSEDPREIAVYLREIQAQPDKALEIRQNARQTAKLYSWENAIDDLFRKIELLMLASSRSLPRFEATAR